MPAGPDLEKDLRDAVARRLGSTRFGLWFGDGVQLGVDGTALVVGVPNGFHRGWIQSHFTRTLLDAGAEVTGRAMSLAFRVNDELEPHFGTADEPPRLDEAPRRGVTVTIPKPAVPGPPPKIAPSTPSERERPRSAARPSRRLDDFVTGPCNRLAHAAALEMAASAGSAFNPLVIHGGIGLGKSHLLEGVAAALRAQHRGMTVLHLTAESFTNGFLDALRSNALSAFRARHRGIDALVLDDVHFLASKRASQDEFLHTFNALMAQGAPVILGADNHPRNIPKLTDELATRFLGGMVVKVEAPDTVTRKAILRSKAAARGIDVPDAVLAYIAEHLRSSVRELEGALHSLIAHATLTGKRLDLNLAKSALRDTIRHTARAVALKDIERAVCDLFAINPDDLKSDGRARALAQPRMIAMYLARKHTGAAYSEIGRHFGGRNHSTVIAAEKKVAGWIADEQRNGLLAGFERVADILAALEREVGA